MLSWWFKLCIFYVHWKMLLQCLLLFVLLEIKFTTTTSLKTNVLWSKNNIAIRFLEYAYQETISRHEHFLYQRSKDKATISPHGPVIWMVVILSIFVVSRWNKNGMYSIKVAMLLWYSSFDFTFGFKDLIKPPLAAIWDFQKLDHSLYWLQNHNLCSAFCKIPSE